jgi:hypothetical protein
MTTLSQFTGGNPLGPVQQLRFFESRNYTIPADGFLMVKAVGAGGGGGRGAVAGMGGNSGAWGARMFRVTNGQTLTVTIGAGGGGRASTDGAGTAGGNTVVTIGAATMTIPGGAGGVFSTGTLASNLVPAAASTPTGVTFGRPNARPGNILTGASTGRSTGGAGVDILGTGTTGTADIPDTTNWASGGGGIYSPGGAAVSNAVGGSAAPEGRTLGGTTSGQTVPDLGWGVALGGSAPGSGGRGGIGGFGGVGGEFAGGGGGNGGTAGGAGGQGGGGGGNGGTATGGNGGPGYVYAEFYAEVAL